MAKKVVVFCCVIIIAVIAIFTYSSLNLNKNNPQTAVPDSPLRQQSQPKTTELPVKILQDKIEYVKNIGVDKNKIKARVELLDNKVNVRQEILLPYETTQFSAYMTALNHAKVDINGISAASITGYEIINDNTLAVNTKVPQSSLTIDYTITLHGDSEIMAYHDTLVLLTNFLLYPAVQVNGSPFVYYTKNIGDPYIYDITDYEIEFICDDKYELFAPGFTHEKSEGKKRVAYYSAYSMRDFPIVAAVNPHVLSTVINNTEITYVNADVASAFVEHSFRFGEENIGEYPYPELFVINTPIGLKGMEFSGMIFLSDKSFADLNLLKNVAYHEIMHQWFYGIIGTNQFAEPYLDEGLATFLANYLCSTAAKPTGVNLIRRTLGEYGNSSHYKSEAYDLAARHFAEVFYRYKEKDYFAILRRVYDEHKFGTLSYDEFMSYFN